MIDHGEYRYFKDGVLSDVTETFRLESAPSGVVVTCERNAPAFGSHMRVLARGASWGGPFSSFDVCLTREASPHRAEAAYRLEGSALSWTRQIDGHCDGGEMTLTPGTLVYPLMRVFLGPVIEQTARLGRANVLTPWITDPTNVSKLLLPHLEEREAAEIPEAIPPRLRRFAFVSAQYDRGAHFDLDPRGVLVRYLFPQKGVGEWRVELRENVALSAGKTL